MIVWFRVSCITSAIQNNALPSRITALEQSQFHLHSKTPIQSVTMLHFGDWTVLLSVSSRDYTVTVESLCSHCAKYVIGVLLCCHTSSLVTAFCKNFSIPVSLLKSSEQQNAKKKENTIGTDN